MTGPDHPGIDSQIKTFLRAARRAVGIGGEVDVCIASNHEMRRLNRDFRGKDRPTDVLSFPAAQNGKIAGDIAISRDIARDNAKLLGHSTATEVRILLLHGLLHLAGYDHESDHGEMAALEQKLRVKLNLPASLSERASKAGHKAYGEPREPANHSSPMPSRSAVRERKRS